MLTFSNDGWTFLFCYTCIIELYALKCGIITWKLSNIMSDFWYLGINKTIELEVWEIKMDFCGNAKCMDVGVTVRFVTTHALQATGIPIEGKSAYLPIQSVPDIRMVHIVFNLQTNHANQI